MICRIKNSRGTFVDRFELKYSEKDSMIHSLMLFKGDKSEEQIEGEPVHRDKWIEVQKEIMNMGKEEGFDETPMYDLLAELLEEVECI